MRSRLTARLLAGLVRSQPPQAVRAVLAEALPWVTFLPEADVDELLAELIAVAQGAASLARLVPGNRRRAHDAIRANRAAPRRRSGITG